MSIVIPYAPGRMYEERNSIGDLIQRGGQQAADYAMRKGDISANKWGSLGQIGTNAVQGYFQQKAERAAQEQAMRMSEQARAEREEQKQYERGRNTKKDELEAEEFAFKKSQAQAEMERREEERQATIAEQLAEAKAKMTAAEQADFVENGKLAGQLHESGAPPEKIKEILDLRRRSGFNIPSGADAVFLDPASRRTFALSAGYKFAAPKEPKEPKAPVYKEINGKTYVMEGTRAIPVEVPDDGGAPTVASGTPLVDDPKFKSLPAPMKTNALAAYEFTKALQDYRDMVEKHTAGYPLSGVEAMGREATTLDAAHQKILTTAAADWGQGALQKPDKEVIMAAVPSVVSWNPLKWGERFLRGGKGAVLEALDNLIAQTEDKLKGSYGIDPKIRQKKIPSALPAPGPAPGRAHDPLGIR